MRCDARCGVRESRRQCDGQLPSARRQRAVRHPCPDGAAVCPAVSPGNTECRRAGQVSWTPACDDFSSGGGTANFSWGALANHSANQHFPRGIVRQVLWTGLEGTRTEVGNEPLTIGSGYRCPVGNSQTSPPGGQNSRHMYGDAVDVKGTGEWTEERFDSLRAAAERAGAKFLMNWNSYASHHLHADWRE